MEPGWCSQLFHEDRRHPDGQGWIEEVELEGLGRRRLTPKRCHDSSPAWSPSGDRIAITNQGIAVIDPDGSNRRQLTEGTHDYWPTCSPDGQQILVLPGLLTTFAGPDRSLPKGHVQRRRDVQGVRIE